MAQAQLKRPSLGQWADLGSLYDARTDIFVERTLLPGEYPEAGVTTTPTPSRQFKTLSGTSYHAKFADLDVGLELAASYLSGMINVAGAAAYLGSRPTTNLTEQISLSYTVTTVEERLSISHELRPYLRLDHILGSGATHVLVGIVWGAQSIMTLESRFKSEQEREGAKRRLQDVSRSVGDATHASNHIDSGMRSIDTNQQAPSHITLFSDVISEPEQPEHLRDAVGFFTNLPSRTTELYGGKGLPRIYTLVPLDVLSYMLGPGVGPDAIVRQPNPKYLENFQTFFDDLGEKERKLARIHQDFAQSSHCISPRSITNILKSLQKVSSTYSSLQPAYRQLLRDVRCGRADQSQFSHLLESTQASMPSSADIQSVMSKYGDKIQFVNDAMSTGINYFGYGSSAIESELARNGIEDAYVLFFAERTRRDSTSWEQNWRLLQQLHKDASPERMVALVDCDAAGLIIDHEYISRYQNARIVVQDVLDQIVHGQCFARCVDDSQLDRSDATRPLRRSPVKIACPGRRCSKDAVQDWVCPECYVPVEYCPMDQFIYCDCGRAHYAQYDFRCKELGHGKVYEQYEKWTLLRLLESLDPLDELNILIIGETGVGKSTFINAFVNYLHYETLDDAMKDDNLFSVIPCSFNVQSMDRNDPHGTITERRVQVGEDSEEKDGSRGQSATQVTTVYPIPCGDTVVRLIDTPGIGDTRGYDQDKENMANILSQLRFFDKLHGILFLLKSNSSRLTFMFRFVVEELLTHLHRDAALNMVFGFTNTRISNYLPGDTFGPLKTMLERHKRVDLQLSPRTVYCFDSESFRFLAAQKNDVVMENVQDFRLSWDKSEKETKRLIEHFRSLSPHLVRSTLSLNQTRALILQLTRPMADIMQEIDATIRLNEDQIADLKDTRLRGDKLRGRLKWEKQELETRPLAKPRTVCNDTSCKQFEDDGSGNRKPIYNSVCHRECYLQNVPAETLVCPELKNCWAFDGKEECRECKHRWDNHLHIYYELTPVRKQVDDEAVVKLLQKNASDIVLKEAAIDNLKHKIAESQYEYKEIQEAAVRFGLFLKQNAITVYNDAMLAYLDHLIKDETDKVEFAGGRRERLDNLLRHRREHQEQIKILTQSTEGGNSKVIMDEAGVEALVDHLYRLKHWGKNLRETKDKAEAAHLQASYRERPYRPQGRGGGGGGNRGASGSGTIRITGAGSSLVNTAVSSAINYFAGNTGGSSSASGPHKLRRPNHSHGNGDAGATAEVAALIAHGGGGRRRSSPPPQLPHPLAASSPSRQQQRRESLYRPLTIPGTFPDDQDRSAAQPGFTSDGQNKGKQVLRKKSAAVAPQQQQHHQLRLLGGGEEYQLPYRGTAATLSTDGGTSANVVFKPMSEPLIKSMKSRLFRPFSKKEGLVLR